MNSPSEQTVNSPSNQAANSPSDQTASDRTPSTGSELRSDARHVSNSAKNRLHSEMDARKGTAANQARSVSSAIDRAAGELDESSPDWIRSMFRQAASQVQRFANTLEQKNSREIVEDIRAFARDNPTTFLAASAAAGFAAARIFKAGGSEQSPTAREQNQGPPSPVEEPMFRASDPGMARQPTGGEFA